MLFLENVCIAKERKEERKKERKKERTSTPYH
jgi:hypothetical protein